MQRGLGRESSSKARPPRFGRLLPAGWFRRPTVVVARDLLGRAITREAPSGISAARVVETEAYVQNDPANHAFRGRTDRNRSMFSRPGTLYVYQIHQVFCANVVTRPGQAVLLRAAEALTPGLPNLSGPGRLCRALGLTREQDGWDLTTSSVRLREGSTAIERILVGTRVGIHRAADRPLRFALQGNSEVSSPRPAGWKRVGPGA